MSGESMSTSLKIAFIGEAVSGFGGMETVIKNVINNFNNVQTGISCDMFFFCRNDKMDKSWLEDINYQCSFSNIKLSLLRRAKHVSAFSQWVRKNSPDIVICIDVISCLLANKARKKSGSHFVIYAWPHFSLDHKKHDECIIYADKFLAISSGIKQQMVERGVDESKITVVYNPVSKKSNIIPSPEAGAPATFIYVGRMKFEGQKRIKDLLEGMSRAEGQWHLHIIGDGSDLEKCQDYGKTLGIEHKITWHGWQVSPWDVVQNDLKNVTALLLTSSFEGFPMTLLEAMSYGVPCISSDCMSGPGDMIQPRLNGALYPPRDIDSLVELLNKTISGELSYNHNQIPETISMFYEDVYYHNLKKTLSKNIK